MRSSSRSLAVSLASTTGILVACSLQIPSEREIFGDAAGQSGNATSGSPTNAGGGNGGSAGAAAAPEGGAAGEPGGSGAAGEVAGGSDAGGSDAGGGDSGGTSAGGTGAGGSDTAGSNSGGTGAVGFDPALGLVAHFPFDETSGSVVENLIDASKSGSYNGNCTHPDGQLGKAVQMRNLSPSAPDWIELPAGLLSDLSTTTITLWTRALSPSRQGGRLLHFSLGSSNAIFFSPDEVNPTTTVAGAHLGGTHSSASFVDLWTTPPPALTDKSWHHVAFSWSSSSIKLYIDGRLLGSQSNPGLTPSDLGETSPNWLGRTPNDAFIALYAELDDLRIYDKVLSTAELAQLYVLR
jgi:hypothetical protein